ncbi:MAG: ADP-forming succinate--CoA ligase subunit beta [Alphaproteobacteria bacterium]
MNIHEYQAKGLLASFGIPLLKGGIAFTPEEALREAQKIGGDLWVVKAQIHAGGRGKGGGVKLAKSTHEVGDIAQQILGMQLITPQTGPQGKKVERVYIEAGCAYAHEYYLSFLLDRERSCITVIASTEGGMEIEEVAARAPEKILTVPIDPLMGFQGFYARQLAFGLGFQGKQASGFMALLKNLYEAFKSLDADLIEINPLVLTKEGEFMVLDAKMSFDDNALYRHDVVKALRDLAEEDPSEIEASKYGLNYIKLDGNIGCMVNGAGLAMSTMDIIQLYGGTPANFLDVGGGATREQVTAAFKLLLGDPHVQGVLVNIFGGIMRCDIIAQGIIEAAKEVNLHVPLVVRLEGTNVEMGKKILEGSGLPIMTAHDLADAAEKIVKAIGKGQ